VKQANVVEVRDVRASGSYDPAYTDPARRERIEKLLHSYPDLSDAETAEIVEFLARGMHLDVGLIGAKDEFQEKVATIRHQHRHVFRLKPVEGIAFLVAASGVLALLVWLPQLAGRF
jgi:hypothetical protein